MRGPERVVALGFFDGVHLAHQALMKKTRERAAELDADACVITFDAHPDTVVFGKSIQLLSSLNDRKELIRRVGGIDDIVVLHFDRHLMLTPWQDFIASVRDEIGAVHLVMGSDFCCGWRGEGTALCLRAWCEENSLGCDIVDEVRLDGTVVSSTYIRELVMAGDVETAARFLGHPHTVSHRVEHGCQRGRRMGAPTVNIPLMPSVAAPRYGVYVSQVWRKEECFPAVTNVGVRPTFFHSDGVTVEANLLDFDGDLYGETVRVEFLHFLRPEEIFPNEAALATQIRRDQASSRTWFQTMRGVS